MKSYHEQHACCYALCGRRRVTDATVLVAASSSVHLRLKRSDADMRVDIPKAVEDERLGLHPHHEIRDVGSLS